MSVTSDIEALNEEGSDFFLGRVTFTFRIFSGKCNWNNHGQSKDFSERRDPKAHEPYVEIRRQRGLALPLSSAEIGKVLSLRFSYMYRIYM